MTTALREFVDNRGVSVRVNREQSRIHGVKLLGRTSKNGREYPEATIQAARSLYEGARVNVNHTAKPGEPRQYQDRMGVIRQVESRADGLYGDYLFNPKHPLAEQLLWDAEHAPENVGFSHDVLARTATKNGKTVVEEITRVNSVDLVANPATTNGLYESEIEESTVDITLEAVKAKPEIIAALLKEERESAAVKQVAADLKALKEENDRLKAEKNAALVEGEIATALTEAKLPDYLVTDVFKTQLREAKDADARKALIEDRKAIAKQAPAPGNKPQSREQRTTEGADYAGPQSIDAKAAVSRWAH